MAYELYVLPHTDKKQNSLTFIVTFIIIMQNVKLLPM